MTYLQVEVLTSQILTLLSSLLDIISPVARVLKWKTNPLCPVSFEIGIPSVVHTLTISSFEQDANPIPGTSVNPLTISSCAMISFSRFPLNQNRIFLS